MRLSRSFRRPRRPRRHTKGLDELSDAVATHEMTNQEWQQARLEADTRMRVVVDAIRLELSLDALPSREAR